MVLKAARVFATSGYDQTSMQELADELGIAAGGIYHYFRGKEELLIAICDQLMEPLLDEARGLVEQPDEHPTVVLRDLVRLWVAHVTDHRDHMVVFLQERHTIDKGAKWQRVRAHRKAFEVLLEEVLRRVEDAGLARYTDRRIALGALLGMVNHTAQWFRPRGRLTPREIADGYTWMLTDRGGG